MLTEHVWLVGMVVAVFATFISMGSLGVLLARKSRGPATRALVWLSICLGAITVVFAIGVLVG